MRKSFDGWRVSYNFFVQSLLFLNFYSQKTGLNFLVQIRSSLLLCNVVLNDLAVNNLTVMEIHNTA